MAAVVLIPSQTGLCFRDMEVLREDPYVVLIPSQTGLCFRDSLIKSANSPLSLNPFSNRALFQSTYLMVEKESLVS